MDYDFTRLSTRSFEQMIQSLSLAIVGPGVNIFGDGPDGGREATFEDLRGFPDTANPWLGYGVIQAKFRQRPGEKDADWALKELKKELDTISNSSLKKPENYIFVTNVVLTPFAEKGGKDRANDLIKKYKTKTGIKNFRIWDYDQLCAFLDLHPSVRTAYKAWITAGDVLASVIEEMKPQREDFRDVMLNFVQKELRTEQFVNLGQAGHSSKDRISLASVFVDLPIESVRSLRGYTSSIDGISSEATETSTGALNNLTRISDQRLDPNSHERRQAVITHSAITKPPGKLVFIGGPGQGKSTLTQFFCQLHRCTFIQQHSSKKLTIEISDACDIIIDQCTQEKLKTPNIARFPLRIELNRFAAALANGNSTSLFDYILNRIQERSERTLDSSDLRKWLSCYPWIIALDGLDEVPASSNRTQVLSSIQDFLIDAYDCNADLLLIATSRPQGYDDDFSESNYEHYKLSELDNEQALHYASRLIKRKWGDDEDKVQTLISRMTRASTEDSTVRLMKSPLQVTIMALLVESLGEPPKERWRLFNEYYQVINRREKERDIPAAKLLNNFQADIDFIHQKVGIRLQIRSEKTGGTDALLTETEFSNVILQRLEEEGHNGEKGLRFKDDVIEAALERLVFLVAPQEGKIGFEIRSLQEFMAAQSITNGTDEEVTNRLRAIAHASHWRNVFLFAAGRCFHERQHLRASILSICSELNEGLDSGLLYDVNKAVLTGSQIALDILEDGAIANQPAQLRIFSRLAIRLIELPPCEAHSRLANLYTTEVRDLYSEAIESKLSDPEKLARLGAWQVLVELVNKGIDWAHTLAEKNWPDDKKQTLSILYRVIHGNPCTWLYKKWFDATLQSSPSELPIHLTPSLNTERSKIRDELEVPDWFTLIVDRIKNPSQIAVRLEEIIDADFELASPNYIKTGNAPEIPKNIHPGWIWLSKIAKFDNNPSELLLSELLTEYAEIIESDNNFDLGHWIWAVSWQLSACLKQTNNPINLAKCSEYAKLGYMGTPTDWSQAQERWQTASMSLESLKYVPLYNLPFDKNIGTIGFPSLAFHPNSPSGIYSQELLIQLRDIYTSEIYEDARVLIANSFLSILSSNPEEGDLIPIELCEILPNIILTAANQWVDYSILNKLPDEYWKSEGILALIDVLATIDDVEFFDTDEIKTQPLEDLIRRNPQADTAIILLSKLCFVGCTLSHTGISYDMNFFESIATKVAALTINISQLDDNIEQSIHLANSLIRLFTDQHVDKSLVIRVLFMIERSSTMTNAIEYFLYTLYKSELSGDHSIKHRLIYLLQEHQKFHLSTSQNILT
jgi:CTP:phosphocholine cytidylyltransferase-like protein